jgi:hypothetical protein
MAARARYSRVAALFALLGGLAQIAAALAVLFLPVLGNCSPQETGELICGRVSYVQLGGNALGYSILIAMIGVGVLAVGSAQDTNRKRILLVRWGGTLFSCMVAIITGFSFGVVFVPGAVLLLVSAAWTTVQRSR